MSASGWPPSHPHASSAHRRRGILRRKIDDDGDSTGSPQRGEGKVEGLRCPRIEALPEAAIEGSDDTPEKEGEAPLRAIARAPSHLLRWRGVGVGALHPRSKADDVGGADGR